MIDLSSPDAADASIEAAYCESGNTLSWKFLYSPFSVLSGAEVAFVALNPGGSVIPGDDLRLSTPSGISAYRDISWRGKAPGTYGLQPQVLALFAWLGVQPDQVLAGNFVPFRSPSWKTIRAPEFSVDFGRDLWRAALVKAQPARIVTLTALVRKEVGLLLEIERFERLPVGWGEASAYRGISPSGTELIGLPHLSRYRLFGREQSETALIDVLGPNVGQGKT